MKLGFTGTKDGMTPQQKERVAEQLILLRPHEVHHGDCVGADHDFHDLLEQMDWKIRRVGHPPVNTAKRAYCKFDIVRENKEYLDRDRCIVRETQVLFATPNGPERNRSGTWYTVRYARKLGRRIFIFWPNGSMTEESPVPYRGGFDGVSATVRETR